MDEQNQNFDDRIIKVDINESMRRSYIDYSMSVIVSRALPDVRDGFKPVHRRILYGMMEMGNTYDRPYKKCARIVGDVLGKYHPHGDSSVYGALVRLGQDWAMRYPLVDGQGNFGSIDGDGAAAMRYTEARLTRLGEAMMEDLYKDTVDFVPNYSGEDREPKVLPTRIPNLLVNGATGIAVGMATNIPTHNLGEVIDACVAMINNPDITTEELMNYVKAPDFPTGGIICGIDGVREAYTTGKGRIVIRALTDFESDAQHERIIVHEIPYGVNKAELIKKIADLVSAKRLEGIANINDESDREGMRIVIDLKREANARVVLNRLYKTTDLQANFNVNCIALVGAGEGNSGRPRLLTLRDCIHYFVVHRHEVTLRRTAYDKRKAEERAHILEGLIVACDNIDEVVHIIRKARSPQEAMEQLMKRFELDEPQSKEIVNMRLRQLTGLELNRLHTEYEDLIKLIASLTDILNNDKRCRQVMKEELLTVKEKWGDSRKTEIDYAASQDFNPEDFYPDESVVVTVSHLGYIKRTRLSEYKPQARGGVGAKGGSARETDFIEYIYPADTHNTMMFFTTKGRVYWMKVYEIPEGNKTYRGRAIQNLLNIGNDDHVTAFLCVKDINDQDFVRHHNLVFLTQKGTIKKARFELYSHPRAAGIRAITLKEGDKVVDVQLTTGNDDIFIASRNGRAVRFNENDVRNVARTAAGMRGIRIANDGEDCAIGMLVFHCNPDLTEEQWQQIDSQAEAEEAEEKETKGTKEEKAKTDFATLFDLFFGDEDSEETQDKDADDTDVADDKNADENDAADDYPEHVMVISEKGVGKRTPLSAYRVTRRGGKGVRTLNITAKTGKLVAVKAVTNDDDLMIINTSGVAIRLPISSIKVQGRNTQGVTLINLKKRNDTISSVCRVAHYVEAEEDLNDNEEESGEPTPTKPDGNPAEAQPTNEE